MLEFATLIMSIVAIAMYAMKKIFGEVAMSALEESGSGDYVNFVTISIWDETFSFILACVVFVSTVKFIKMLKFNRRMGMLGDTIRLATKVTVETDAWYTRHKKITFFLVGGF